ncbi:outer membrane autotransporter barrel domain-containing protein [Brucella sp. F5/06]|nr:outer membrane autotransporter barrel domain-containing protein [Brucella sp. F5/06]
MWHRCILSLVPKIHRSISLGALLVYGAPSSGTRWWDNFISRVGRVRELRRLVLRKKHIDMRSVRTVIRSSAVLIAVLYATVSVHAGGQGGYGAFNSEPYGYPGGDGNSATGMGGDGGQGLFNPSPGGAGGTVGSLITSPTTIISNITGGAGGHAVDQTQFAGNGGGGGGTGVATASDVTNDATIIGGQGGRYSTGNYQGAGGGGGGGAGVATSANFTNNSTVIGGAGGLGANAGRIHNSGGGGGGAGVYVVGNSALVTIINNGTITGGAGGLNSAWSNIFGATGGMGEGGAAGSIRTGGRQGTSSQGGAGIIGANIAVINNGTITGGIGGTGGLNAGVQNDAVTFQSGINSLTLTTKSVINGVVSANGNDDTLTLQNTLSKIDGGQSDGANISATQYKGFEHLVVNGGRWTVSGSAIVSGETTLNGGALVVTGPAALGVQAITAQGGAIEAPGDQVLDQSFVLKNNPYGASTSGLVVQGADNLVLSGVLSDVGRLTKNGSGTLTLSGANSYTGATTVSAGILTLTGDNTGGGTTTVDAGAVLQIGTGGTSGNLAGDIANNGALVVNRSDALNLANAISGAGSLMKSGAGTLTLSGANSYTGATTVSAGILTQGAAGGFSTASSRYDVDTDGTLDLGGFDTMLAALYNAGTINMNVGAAGSTLMVNGDYVGHDGTIVFNTVLGDDNSKTDKLMVGGDTAGNTNVQVVNRDGLGAQTVKGIEIITVGGQSNGVFSLVSDYRTKDGQKAVVGGAYAYTLHQGPARGANDGNWYLISQLEDIKPDNPATRRVSDTPDAPDTPAPRYSANVPVYEGYVQTMQALNKPSTLQERVGKRYMTGENGDGRTSGGMVDAHGIWARIQGAHDRLEPTTLTGMKQEINTFILQAGVDGQFYEDENGKLIAGITGQYGTARSNIVARDGDGRISTNAWSLGATATWIGNDGFYVDTQGQVTWFESDLNSDTADVGLASGRKATGYALSVETGKRIALNGNWALTPQAQLIWSSINADDFEDVWQANISVARGNSFAARFGLAASYDSSWQGSDGRVVNTSVYGITNLYQEFLGGTRVNISGVDFSTDNDRTWAGIGAGGTYAWAGGKYLIFGQGTINTSLDHFADSYAIKGDVGFKVKW